MIVHHYGLWAQHPEGSAAANKLNNQERTGFRKCRLEEEQNLCRPGTGGASPAFVRFDFILCPLTLSFLTMQPNLLDLLNSYLLQLYCKR